MGVVSKSGIKFSIIQYVGIVIGYINTILIFPRVLSEEEFGLIKLLASAATVVAQFSILGGDNAIIRFAPYFKNKNNSNTILSIGFVIAAVGLTLTSITIFFFRDTFNNLYKDNSKMFVDYFYLLAPYVVSIVFFNLFDAYLRVLFKNAIVVFLSFIVLRVIWLITVLIYYFGWVDISTFLLLYVGCQTLITIICAVYLIKLKEFKISFKFDHHVIKSMKSIGWFGLFTILSGLSFLLINRLDILMIGKYIGLDAVAIYSIAFNMSTVILVPSSAISRTISVILANASKENDREKLNEVYKKTALNQLLFGMLIFALIAINYNLMMMFLPEYYQDSLYIFLFLGGTRIIDTAFGMNGPIIINSKYYRVDTLLSFFLLIITFATNVYCIPKYGVLGAAFATTFSITLFNVFKYLFLKIKLNLTPFDLTYLKGLGICIIGVAIPVLIPETGSVWLTGIIKSVIMVALFTSLMYFSKISIEFNQILVSVMSKTGLSKKN